MPVAELPARISATSGGSGPAVNTPSAAGCRGRIDAAGCLLATVWGVGIFGRKSTDTDPAFGYGRGKRPSWTVRDRDAEAIREVLRKTKRAEFSDAGGGFVVEGGENAEPFLVACADEGLTAAGEIAAYTKALTAAGFRVEPEPDDDQMLQVWIPTP
jgi:hypothetical protein